MIELLALDLEYLTSNGFLAGSVGMALLLAIWLVLRIRDKSQEAEAPMAPGPVMYGRGRETTAEEATAPMKPIRPKVSMEVEERVTQSDLDLRGYLSSTSAIPISVDEIPSPQAAAEVEERDPRKAGEMWMRRGDIRRALDCFERAQAHVEAARLHRSIGQRRQAADHFSAALRANPGEEPLRLELLEMLLDLGRIREAQELVEAVGGDVGELKAGARFFEIVGLRFEAAGRDDLADKCYRRALEQNDALASVLTRQKYLSEKARLRKASTSTDPTPIPIHQEGSADPSVASRTHKAIVGHVALGKEVVGTPTSVRSLTNFAARFSFERPMTALENVASFAAQDRILDIPVLLRIFAITPEMSAHLGAIDQRMKVIAEINHPNICKLVYADRDAQLLRVVYEFLPGGNLRDFIARLPAIGVPLLSRMALQITYALDAFHRHGVPHGDVEYVNILIGHDQRLKLSNIAPLAFALGGGDDTRPEAYLANSGESVSWFRRDLEALAGIIDHLVKTSESQMKSNPALGASPSSALLPELAQVVEDIRANRLSTTGMVQQQLENILERSVSAPNRLTSGPPPV
ncbi:MAG: protein kinase [Candidatus Sumerlaeia bacterium]|nr:protein kinase [Candidatus Sumerlaeia bacterium]